MSRSRYLDARQRPVGTAGVDLAVVVPVQPRDALDGGLQSSKRAVIMTSNFDNVTMLASPQILNLKQNLQEQKHMH